MHSWNQTYGRISEEGVWTALVDLDQSVEVILDSDRYKVKSCAASAASLGLF